MPAYCTLQMHAASTKVLAMHDDISVLITDHQICAPPPYPLTCQILAYPFIMTYPQATNKYINALSALSLFL